MKSIGTLTWLPDGQTQPAYEELTVLSHAMNVDRDHPQACGGHSECGTCRVRIVSGDVSPMFPDERVLMEDFPESFQPDERLACQVRPSGDVVVEVIEGELPDLRD